MTSNTQAHVHVSLLFGGDIPRSVSGFDGFACVGRKAVVVFERSNNENNMPGAFVKHFCPNHPALKALAVPGLTSDEKKHLYSVLRQEEQDSEAWLQWLKHEGCQSAQVNSFTSSGQHAEPLLKAVS